MTRLFDRRIIYGLLGALALSGAASAQTFTITRAEWSSDGGRLRVEGSGTDGRTVTIKNAGSGAVLGTDTVDDGGDWGRRISRPSPVPCRVRAEQSGGAFAERDVSNRPSNCGPVAVQPSIAINNVTVAEGSVANFTLTLSAASTQTVTVVASTANGSASAGSDYTARSSVTVTFPAGSTTQTFAVTTLTDTASEGSETFNVNLSGATNATIADAQGVGTITNVAPAPTASLSINDVSVNEGQTASFTVTLSAPSTQTVTVVASTANGTASAGSDYTARSNVTLSFPAGTTTQTFAVATLTDSASEGSETFSVGLSGATNATIADATGVGTIANVAPTPTLPSLSVNDLTVTEGNTATFMVSLSAAASSSVTVVFSTSNGTATAGSDYTAVSNRTLTIAAGQTSVTTQVVTTNDTVAEASETFNVTLSSASGATIADAQGVGTIVDNDFTSAAQAHATMTTYDGPQTCVACHEAEARKMHGSVHYQQNGPTDFVTNIAGNAGEGPAGKTSGVDAVIGINTYCGTHENSPRFTCAGCHVGNGRFPKTPGEMAALGASDQLKELSNIDCLMCHQQAYKRFPDWTSAGAGFSDLTLRNVTLDANGQLVAAPGQTVTRTGLAGIPNVDSITFDFVFRPSGAPGSLNPLPAGAPQQPMTLTTEQAAQQVHATTRQSCLNCHAGAAGANGAKRGDLSTANIASTDLTLDRHMATTGSNMTCSACHNVNDTSGNSLHRVRGRGLDLRANDVATRFTCDNAGCHNASTVHSAVTNAARLTRHTNKVACQTCHIPRYGKGIATEVARDWQAPHVTQTACNGRGGWLPNEIKSSTATPPAPVNPTYQWFDGNSQVYYLTESLTGTPTKPLPAAMATALNMPAGTPAYIMGRPTPNSGASAPPSGAPVPKIYPMKEHWGKLARNTANNTLIASSTFEFFRTGSFCRAVALGLNPQASEGEIDVLCPNQNSPVPSGTQVVAVHTYQTINHGVEPQANALGYNNTCGACHSVNGMTGGPARMDLKGQLGYRVRTTIGWTVNSTGTSTCSNSCHSSKSASFISFHERSQHIQRGCNACHDQIAGR